MCLSSSGGLTRAHPRGGSHSSEAQQAQQASELRLSPNAKRFPSLCLQHVCSGLTGHGKPQGQPRISMGEHARRSQRGEGE